MLGNSPGAMKTLAEERDMKLIQVGLALWAGLGCLGPGARAADTPAEWGRPAQGVVVGLRIAEPAATVGQPLAFRLEVRNPGAAEVKFAHLGRREAWQLQFESEAGELFEYQYHVQDARLVPLKIAPGAIATVGPLVIDPDAPGNFRPLAGLTELPAGRYLVRAFVPFYETADEMPKHPTALTLGKADKPNWLISNQVGLRIGAEGEPGLGGDAAGWTVIGDARWRQDYRRLEQAEEVFSGELERLEADDGPSTLQRTHSYRLGSRLIGGRPNKVLDAFVGKEVEVRGKPLDFELEGRFLSELVPALIRPAAGRP